MPPTCHVDRHHAMQERYGFGLFDLPAYRDTAVGTWRLRRHGMASVTGYASGSTFEPLRHVLYQGRIAWMSTSLMEQESHAPHVHAARGTVVVAGLGMGMFAHAVALKPEVERLVVIERDPTVIALLQEATDQAAWPGHEKLTFLQADALAPDILAQLSSACAAPIDYFYADIWPTLAAKEAPGQMISMVRALQPQAAGWWGQELAFGQWCQEQGREPDDEALESFAAAMAIPMVTSAAYGIFCRDVIAHRLPKPRRQSFWRLFTSG